MLGKTAKLSLVWAAVNEVERPGRLSRGQRWREGMQLWWQTLLGENAEKSDSPIIVCQRSIVTNLFINDLKKKILTKDKNLSYIKRLDRTKA